MSKQHNEYESPALIERGDFRTETGQGGLVVLDFVGHQG